MQTTSALWKQYQNTIALPAKQFPTGKYTYKVIIGADTYYDADIVSMSSSMQLCNEDAFTIGNVFSRRLNITIRPKVTTIPKMAAVEVYVMITGTLGDTEYISHGKFYIDTRTRVGQNLSLECFDGMLLLEAPFVQDNVPATWPYSMADSMTLICARAGLTFDNPETIQATFDVNFINELTMREVAANIADVNGGNFIITDEGNLRLVIPVNGTSVNVPPYKSFEKLNVGDVYSKLYLYDSSEFCFTSGIGSIEFTDHNLYATQLIADYILSILEAYTQRAFSAQGVYMDPSIELGDTFSIEGVDYVLFNAIITYGSSITYNIGSPGEAEVNHEYPYIGSFAKKIKTKVTLDELYNKVMISRLGGIQVFDDVNAERVQIGDLGDGSYGMRLKNENDDVTLETDSNGNLHLVGSLDIGSTIAGSDASTVASNASTALANAATAQAAADNIQIGGRNLLLNSDIERASSTEYLGIDITAIAIANLNKVVTFSFDLKSAIAGTVRFYNLGGYHINTDAYCASTTSYQRFTATGLFTYSAGDANGDVCALSFYGEYGTGVIPTVKNIKVEIGNKATDWTPAPEDVNTLIATAQAAAEAANATADTAIANALTAHNLADAAQAAADTAHGLADTAQGTANTASANADTANGLLADLANDSKLTAVEKQAVKTEWDGIVSEVALNDAQAITFGVSKTAYDSAYSTLSAYIASLLADLATTSDIVGTTFRTNFKNYYDTRTNLLNSIASASKTLADTAQTRADLGVTNAATAQTQANTATTNAATAQTQADTAVANALTAHNLADAAQAAANAAQAAADTAHGLADTAQTQANLGVANAATANGLLADIASDIKITPVEKLAAKQLWDTIVIEGTATTGTIPAQATVFDVPDTAFDTDYAALNTYLNTTLTVFANMTTTTTIVRATWDTAWKNYYDERTKLLDAIATKAKTLADEAQTTADSKKEVFISALVTSLVPTFARNSVAYKADGTEVAVDIPRFEKANLITNGNFANGTMGWYAGFGTLSAVDNTLSISGGNQVSYAIVNQVTQADATLNRKIYICAKMRVTNSDCLSVTPFLRDDNNTNITGLQNIANPSLNQWYNPSNVFTLQGGLVGKIKVCFEADYANATTANGKVMQVQEAMVIDLTVTFGAGNEPTLAQCDDLYKNWFGNALIIEEGTTNILINSKSVVNLVENGSGAYVQLSVELVHGQTYTLSHGDTDIVVNPEGWPQLYIWQNTWGNSNINMFGLTPKATTFTLNTESGSYVLSVYNHVYPVGGTINNLQLEAKPYATSWTDGVREAETLMIPTAEVLNAVEGTVEFSWNPQVPISSIISQNTSPKLLQIGDYYGNSSVSLWAFAHDGGGEPNLVIFVKGQTSAGWSTNATLKASGTGWYKQNEFHRFAISWSSGSNFKVYMDGVLIGGPYTIADIMTSFSGGFIFLGGTNALYDDLRVSNIVRTDAEIAAQFKKGVSLTNRTSYNPTTWVEWYKPSGVIGDSTGLEFTADGTYIGAVLVTALKPSTNYGYLLNIVNNPTVGSFRFYMDEYNNMSSSNWDLSTLIGNQKFVNVSDAATTYNHLTFYLAGSVPIGDKVKFKDFRVFELPAGSEIESDFTNLTADQLSIKYLWFSDVVLPVDSYTTAKLNFDDTILSEGYTPIPPYNIGDLWADGATGDLMKCVTAKAVGDTYSATDWDKAVAAVLLDTPYNQVKISIADGIQVFDDAATPIERVKIGDLGSNRYGMYLKDKDGNITFETDSDGNAILKSRVELPFAGMTNDVAVPADDDVRIWAGSSFANRGTAPFRVTKAGALYASNVTLIGSTGYKKGTGTFTDNDTSQTFADDFCTVDALVLVSITSATASQGTWIATAEAGQFTILSTKSETADITFDYYIMKWGSLSGYRHSNGIFSDNDTAQTFADTYCTTDSLVVVTITSGTSAGTWIVNSYAGYFIITSNVAESADILFDYYIVREVPT